MAKSETLKPGYFLNRIALDKMVNSESADPYNVIKDVFSFAQPDELHELFSNFCTAALADKYAWTDGSPSNLLVVSEKLELLIEAGYLISKEQKKKPLRKPGKKPVASGHIKSLSETERENPRQVIEEFFSSLSLAEWKRLLRSWTEAGLSRYTILDEVEAESVPLFCRQIEKLIAAAYAVSFRGSRKT